MTGIRISLQMSCLAIAVALASCARTTTTTSWPSGGNWVRPGTVESVQEVVRRVQGNPAAGALAGALIGGILFHDRGPATLFGAAAGATIGAAASQGSAESRAYQVVVRFDDGTRGMFVYQAYSPFRPGQRVELSPAGLRPMLPPQAPPPPSREQGESNAAPECTRDEDCVLLPSTMTCCAECPPAPPFEAAPASVLDGMLVENETVCSQSRKPCTPAECVPVPEGCVARAACDAGQCVAVSSGCEMPNS